MKVAFHFLLLALQLLVLVSGGSSGGDWTVLMNSTTQFWTDISTSFTGRFAAATTRNGSIFITANYGESWTLIQTVQELTRIPSLNAVTMSSSGKYMAAVGNHTGMILSQDFGATWSAGYGPNSKIELWDIAISANNEYKYVVGQINAIYWTGSYSNNFASTKFPSDYTFTSVSCSSSGSIVAATQTNGQIYLSTNNGRNFKVSNSISEAWTSVAVSYQTGEYIYAVSSTSDLLYMSTNTGRNWTSVIVTNDSSSSVQWTSVATDITGTNIAITSNNSCIYQSNNHGLTWAQTTSETQPWSAIAMNGNGSLLYAVESPGYIYMSGAPGNITQLSNNTWTQSNASEVGYAYITASSAGQYVAAISYGSSYYQHLYVSRDYGQTYELTLPSTNIGAVAMSSSGEKMAAVLQGSTVYYSSNYGVDWTSSAALPVASSVVWYGMTASDDFQYVFVITQQNGICISNNGAVSFVCSPLYEAVVIDCSSSGQYIAVGMIYAELRVSNNYGASFYTPVNTAGTSSDIISSVTVSGSGQYMAAAVLRPGLLLSSDYGATWALCIGFKIQPWFTGVSYDRAGDVLVVSVTNGLIFQSQDHGASWNAASDTLQDWNCVTISGNGTMIFAGQNPGGLYYSTVKDYNQSFLLPTRLPTQAPTYAPTVYIPFSVTQYNALHDLFTSTHGDSWTWQVVSSTTGVEWNFSMSVMNGLILFVVKRSFNI